MPKPPTSARASRDQRSASGMFVRAPMRIEQQSPRTTDEYQIETSFGYSRWGAGAYRSTCYPAWF